ncbi:hypothetical protein ACFBZI_11095 [Moraxella sp. ZJ142]|uniref:hypothetical protein n=1 Tax=Moraxella marmotae TaxID=3344520 RepID=UPI0035D4DF46
MQSYSHLPLQIELVPKTAWFQNLRSLFTKEQWNFVRRHSYKRANNRCEICAGRGPKWPVECHEEWNYNEQDKTVTLKKATAICPACHEVKHFGFANINGRSEEALSHLMLVNQLSRYDAEQMVQQAFDLWERRSKFLWTLDIERQKAWINQNIPLPDDVAELEKQTNDKLEQLKQKYLKVWLGLGKDDDVEQMERDITNVLLAHEYGKCLEETLELRASHLDTAKKKLTSFKRRMKKSDDPHGDFLTMLRDLSGFRGLRCSEQESEPDETLASGAFVSVTPIASGKSNCKANITMGEVLTKMFGGFTV